MSDLITDKKSVKPQHQKNIKNLMHGTKARPWDLCKELKKEFFIPFKIEDGKKTTNYKNWVYNGPWDINPALWGLVLKHTNWLVVDDDIEKAYKKRRMAIEQDTSKKSPLEELDKLKAVAQKWIEFIQKKATFKTKTISGGFHYYFNNPLKINKRELFGGMIEILSGYSGGMGKGSIAIWYSDIEFESKDFIDFDPIWIPPKSSKNPTSQFGPGQNNRSIKKRALQAGNSESRQIQAFIELCQNNKGNPELEKHVRDFLHNREPVIPHPADTQKQDLKFAPKESKPEPVKWLIEDWVEAGSISLFAGTPGSGKSMSVLKIACLNADNKSFWNKGPKGDGRKSIYICGERKLQSSINRVYAAGGNTEKIEIIDRINGQKPNLSDTKHFQTLMDLIIKGDYAFVIIDPLVNLELDKQDINSAVRLKLEKIVDKIENSNTAILGIMHLKKDRKSMDDLGSIRGASEWVNVSTGVFKAKELKDDEGYVWVKLKVTESKLGKRGGLKYKITSIMNDHGGIDKFEYIDQRKDQIDKAVVKEFDFQKETPEDKIKRVIARLEAENKELNTTIIKALAKAEGVTGYYLKVKLDFPALGYKPTSIGQGSNQRVILLKK